MNQEPVVEHLQGTSELLSSTPEMNEANTKAKVVQPLLESLGWSITSDAILEYGFQMGATTHYVDYALTVREVPELFVEVKGSYTSLSDNHLEQLATYMKTQNVDWGLLTNGQRYQVCRRRVDSEDDVFVEILGQATIEELSEDTTLLSVLSRESISEGRSEEIASEIYRLREVYEEIQERREELVEEVSSTLVDELGDAISTHAHKAARTAVEDLSSTVESDLMSVPEVTVESDFWTKTEAETGIVKREAAIILPESQTATQCFAEFVDFLFAGGYLSAEDVPIESGQKRYLVNTAPVDREGDDMYSPKEVGDGYYLETNYSRNDIKQRILDLGEQYGH